MESLQQKLAAMGQSSVLRFEKDLDPPGRNRLHRQLENLDLDVIHRLVGTYVKSDPKIALPHDIQPVRAFPRMPVPGNETVYAKAAEHGRKLVNEGKVGAFLVAGGQGTRLGYDGPKGEFPVTPVRNKPLFQVFAEQLKSVARDAGRSIAWYIMTSDVNDAPTRAFFAKHSHFGINPADIFFFQQGMMPAFALDGTMLLAEKDSLALSPDGHGGSLRAIEKSGALADMQKRGIEHLSYFQVDNPLVHCIDPLFLGLHDLAASDMSSKIIPKAGPLEKVGNFAVGDGVLQTIEYSDLPDELARQTNPDGTLRFNAGNIAVHALRVDFIKRLNDGGELKLPWHRALKKVPYLDAAGTVVKPDKPNAIKLEQFVFDAIPLAKNPMVFETERGEEFSPVKNAEGGDSPATSRADQVRRAVRWLTAAGVKMEEGRLVEISPLYALTAGQLKMKGPIRINPGSVYLE